jgi:hypothetical protein
MSRKFVAGAALAIAALLAAATSTASAQGVPAYQLGTAVPKHIAAFARNGEIVDGSVSGISALKLFGLGTPGCIYDALPTANYSLCFGADSGGRFLLDMNALGGAPAHPFVISIDGVEITWPGNLMGETAPANEVFAGPASGGSGATLFRPLVNADLPIGTGRGVPAICANAAGDGVIIQTAVNTGRPVHIIGPCVGDTAVVVSTNGQEIFGDGLARTVITVSTVIAGSGTFKCNTGQTNNDIGPFFHDLGITFQQVNTSSRTSLTNFKPAFSCRNTPGGMIERVMIEEAMVGVDLVGQSGDFTDQLLASN